MESASSILPEHSDHLLPGLAEPLTLLTPGLPLHLSPLFSYLLRGRGPHALPVPLWWLPGRGFHFHPPHFSLCILPNEWTNLYSSPWFRLQTPPGASDRHQPCSLTPSTYQSPNSVCPTGCFSPIHRGPRVSSDNPGNPPSLPLPPPPSQPHLHHPLSLTSTKLCLLFLPHPSALLPPPGLPALVLPEWPFE